MPSRPSRAPDRLGAGYHKFQRRLSRTVERSDLRTVVPKLSRRARDKYTGFARSFPLPAVLGIGAALLLVAGIFLGLASAGSESAAKVKPVAVDDARPVSLQVSGGFGVDGSFVRDPDTFTDPNAGASARSDDPLSRLIDAVDGDGTGGDGSGSGAAGGAGAATALGTRAESGAPVGTLSNPELVKLFEATNAERAAHGLDPLVLDTSLNRSAQRHADWMSDSGVLCHSNECDAAGEPDQSVWNGWGENIGYSVKPTADVLQNAFLESAPHKANMLDPRHHYVGLGWAMGYVADTDRLVVFAVVQFGMQRR